MTISLRVVGIFYRSDVTLPSASGTVKEVLDAAQSADPSFNYATSSSGGLNSPSIFSADYANPFVSPESGITYPAGQYSLQEHLTSRPAYSVWQYYIFDADNKFINRGKGFVPYDSPNAVVKDGQSVVWRLLNILAQPTGTTPRLKTMFK